MSEPVIEVRHLSKSFGTHVVLRDVDFTVNAGDVTCIIGASGSGNPRCCAASICWRRPRTARCCSTAATSQPRGATLRLPRKVGMVFQSFNLFNNMTVLDNCTAGLRYVLHQDKETAKKTALENLEKVGMAPTSTPSRASFPAARSSALRLPAPWRCSPRCCCSTSRRPPLTRRWSVKCWPSCASWPKRA